MSHNINRTEIELKILAIDKAAIDAKLIAVGAKKIFDRVMTRTLVFDHPTLRLRQVGKVLRLRQVGNKVFLSIKAGHKGMSQGPFQTLQESELSIDNFTEGFKLLESLGFVAFRYQEKLRTAYTYYGVKIEVDEYPKIPPYLEIEAESEKAVTDFLSRLGYKMEETVKMSATQVLRHYGLKDVDIIRFPGSTASEGIFK